MFKKLLLCGIFLFNQLWCEVREPHETLQLECSSSQNLIILWLQVDLERNEHIAWIPSNPMQSIILKKMRIAPTEINFEFQGSDLSINRNNGNLNWNNLQYDCSKISMEDSQNSRNKKLEEIKKKRLF